jgi:formate-dependent nitrite reductase membrane component NrfD
MSAIEAAFVGKQFKIGLRRQKTWGADMAISFFFGEFGAGLFLLSLCFGYLPGITAGLVIAVVGKSVGHILHLGRPERAWRAITMLGNSWLSRGLLSIILYSGFGGAYVLNAYLGYMPMDSLVIKFCAFVAGAAALVIMLYQGLIMSHSAAITLWASGLMPVIGMAYAFLSGSSVLVALGYNGLFSQSPELLLVFKTLQLLLLLVVGICIWGLLHAANYGTPGGKESVKCLLSGQYAMGFWGGIVVIGILCTALIAAFAPVTQQMAFAALTTQIIGFISFRLLMLKAGNYDAIMNFSPRR